MTTREIKLRVQDESDLYDPMDPDRNMLSEDVVSYLTRVFLNKHRRLREEYVLHIISDTPVDETHIKETVRTEFDRQKNDLRFALKRLMVKLICLSVLGAAILSLWLYLSATTETVGVEILSIMGWVCVWEATSIAILQRPELQRMWFNLDRLTQSKIVVHTAEEQKETVAD